MSRTRKILIGLAAFVGVVVLAIAVAAFVANEPRPTGEPGPAADALARDIMASVDAEAWAKTGVVEWDFGGRQQHLWDRQRMLARVTWGSHRVWIDLGSRAGVAHTDGAPVEGEAARTLLDRAYAHWANDSFWLDPFSKFFDAGTTRAVRRLHDGPALLVSYSSGGVTPGDAYLWIRGEDGKPARWKMWVSIIPIGGLSTTWAGWKTTETGAQVSTEHRIAGTIPLALEAVRTGARVEALYPDADPFAPLAK